MALFRWAHPKHQPGSRDSGEEILDAPAAAAAAGGSVGPGGGSEVLSSASDGWGLGRRTKTKHKTNNNQSI